MSVHDVIAEVQDCDLVVVVAPLDHGVEDHFDVLWRLQVVGPPQEPVQVRLRAVTLDGGRTPIGSGEQFLTGRARGGRAGAGREKLGPKS